jgi:hypothetical protein
MFIVRGIQQILDAPVQARVLGDLKGKDRILYAKKGVEASK